MAKTFTLTVEMEVMSCIECGWLTCWRERSGPLPPSSKHPNIRSIGQGRLDPRPASSGGGGVHVPSAAPPGLARPMGDDHAYLVLYPI